MSVHVTCQLSLDQPMEMKNWYTLKYLVAGKQVLCSRLTTLAGLQVESSRLAGTSSELVGTLQQACRYLAAGLQVLCSGLEGTMYQACKYLVEALLESCKSLAGTL